VRKDIRKAFSVALAAVICLSQSSPSSAISPQKAMTVTQLLATLKVKPEANSTTYNRDLFQHWSDADSDGCDTRDEVLEQESKTKTDCSLVGGTWASAYDGVKTTNPSSFDVDHFIPLKEAWESGAFSWDSDTRENFANDLAYEHSLIAVSASSNRSKGDRDPASWLPKAQSFTCQYIGRWIAVKYRWNLSIDTAEKKILATKLATCGTKSKVAIPTQVEIQSGIAPTPEPSTPTSPSGTTQLDPKFTSCAEAKKNGYAKPYKKGINPEYAWYQDRDKDGVVCE
jgi:hypothetical protein